MKGQTIEADLERMDIETFLMEYSIDWSPPGSDDGGD